MDKDIVLHRFFNRVKRLEVFQKFIKNADSSSLTIIIKQEEELIKKSLVELKEYGIDGEKYLNSAKGQAEYIMYCSMEDAKGRCYHRCSVCQKYFYDGRNVGCCGNIIAFSEICNEFLDSQQTFEERIQEYFERCMLCDNADIIENYGLKDVVCKLNKNIMVDFCEYYSNKKQ